MPAPARLREHVDACPGVFAPHDAADGALARVRLPGGAIGAAALRTVAACAEELGDGRVHLTSRGNLQLRGLTRDSDLGRRLAAAGLLPSATHERVRNVLASPLSGIAAGTPPSALRSRTAAPGSSNQQYGSEVREMAAALDRGLCARPGLAALPGRFLFALDDGRGDVAAEEPDLCWQAVVLQVAEQGSAVGAPTGVLRVAGVSVATVDRADAVATLLDAAEAFLALRAADGGTAWRAAELADGPARIGAVLTASYGLRPDASRVALLASNASSGTLLAPPRAHVLRTGARAGVVLRDDGGVALVVAPVLGELTADQVRLLAAAGLVVAPGPAADLSACAGRPGCAKALADVRADARAAFGQLPAGRMHVSGCARRCGAPRAAHVDAVARDGGGYLVDGVPRPGLVP